ncbi:member of the karyopherin-beta [Emydomyces testavorans]|uniref:Member of the karyopherin-beta n=1 Tax=Emydomyces testavorans TaxID=2070801 RepID=A0AAF0DDG8_9EURO|nr:member of the karyopherin-beta [Emydomyces testavorans]
MTAMFFKSQAPWTYCIRHVAISLANGKYLPEAQSDQQSFQALVLPSLNYDRLLAVVSFSTTLAEESIRYPSTSIGYQDRLAANLNDAFFLINYAFQRAITHAQAPAYAAWSEQSRNTAQEAIQSLHAWVSALRSIRIDKIALINAVNVPLTCAIRFLSEPRLAPITMELLTDILTNQPKLLGFEHFNRILDFLISQGGQQYALAILKGDFDDAQMRFLELLLKFASSEEQVRILTEPPDEKYERILFFLFKLFHAPGFAAVEDMTSNLLIEFWTEAADSISELILEGAFDEPTPTIKENFSRVVVECFDKLRYPTPSTLKEWDDDDVKVFNAFRRDFSDFLLATYPLLGVPIIQQIQERAAIAIRDQDWERFEVAMFCLAALAETVAENEHADDLLHALFQSELFDAICYSRTVIPLKARQTLSEVISRYTPYFGRNHNLLPSALNFLFTSLDTPSSEQAAARSISRLCGTCRPPLTVYIGDFINKFSQLHANPSTSCHTLERVVEGIASVIQAIASEPGKANLLVKLLDPLCQEAKQACETSRNGQQEAGLVSGLRVINCTASIGKGLRAPDESVIDLDGEHEDHGSSFWVSDPRGVSLQALIIQILEYLVNEFSVDGDIIEGACDVLKAGYTEKSPGPYVLPPQMTVRFVKAVNMTSTRFPVVMGTASAFLASRASNPSQVHNEVVELIVHVYNLMFEMARDPSQYDPEAAHSCIDFLTRLLPKYSESFFSLSEAPPGKPLVVPAILHFTIVTLKGPDTLPLRAACSFWTALLTLPDLPPAFTPDDHFRGQQPSGAPKPFDAYLAQLADVVIKQVAGRCARSDIDHFSEVLKKFAFKHQGAARIHLGSALASLHVALTDQPVPSPAAVQQMPDGDDAESVVSKAERERFLSSILAMRGSRATNNIVRDFWVACRGKGFAYA